MSAAAWALGDLQGKLADENYARELGKQYAKTAIGLALARARMARHLTQDELAARVGVRQSYIAQLESGEANPTIAKVGQIMAVLGFRLAASPEEWTPAPTWNEGQLLR